VSAPDESAVEVMGEGPLRGTLRPPGDKSISHRALLIAARAEGTSLIRGLLRGDDVARTAAAVRALGAELVATTPHPSRAHGAARFDELRVTGGEARLHEPVDVIDTGNSGTGIRLLTGYVAAWPWMTVLTGDESIRRRPMDRVTIPRRDMGARIDGRSGGALAPLVVRGGSLHAIDYTPPVPSAQVKSAVLLAGLGTDGETQVREIVPTRAHTEEMLALARARIVVEPAADGRGRLVRIGRGELAPFEIDVPADPSQAAFLVVAACTVPGSEVVLENVYVGRGRAGFLDVLERMGAKIELRRRDATTADIVAWYGPLHATDAGGDEIPGLIDEVPVLAVAAALAEGTTTFRDVGELRVKESDRIASVTSALGALGGRIEGGGDVLSVTGGRLHGGHVSAAGDHRIAMAAAVAALSCEEPVRIDGWGSVATSYPAFLDDLAGLRRT
jgi:3-phosphoshikimate 1-carboxyvinyltransferase